MGKIAFVFAGQGAQYTGMGKEICEASPVAKAVFDMAEKVRPGTKEQCFTADKEVLSVTVNTQPCLFAVDLAIAEALAEVLAEGGKAPEGAAGFSLGELPALTFAGAFSENQTENQKNEKEDRRAAWERGFRLVIKRGEAMDKAASQNEGGMAAVLKLSREKVEELCREQGDVYPVNFNSPAQTVVAGKKEALAEFAQKVKGEKGLAMPLAVSGAFHSPYMASAAEELSEELATVNYRQPALPVYANVDARPYPEAAEEGRARLAAQVKTPVQWQRTVEEMAKDGFDTFVEVGPGKTLSGLIKKILPGASVYNVENAADLQHTADALLSDIQE